MGESYRTFVDDVKRRPVFLIRPVALSITKAKRKAFTFRALLPLALC
jgi:hypothetical protein